MFLAAYQAAVECRGAFTPRESCSTIMDDMETTQVSQIFAPRNDPAAQVPLPVIMRASKLHFSPVLPLFLLAITYLGEL